MPKTPRTPPPPPITIGWREYVAFPQWGIAGVLAKVDTGARTSSLHVADIAELEDGRVRFDVVLSRRFADRRVRVEARQVRTAQVRSSRGDLEPRRVVVAQMQLGTVLEEIEIGLVCRKKMICRMLLGRSALAGRFLVDADKAFTLGPAPRRKEPGGATP